MTMQQHSEFSSFHGRGSLAQVLNELNRQKESKIDFVADTRQMSIESTDSGLRLIPSTQPEHAQIREFLDRKGVAITDRSLQQIGSKCSPEIPTNFLRKLAQGKPELTSSLINGMFDDGARRLVRCLDGNVRAFLSDRYRVLDNFDLAFAALETVQKHNGEVIEAQLTERHMRLKFTSRDIWQVIEEKRTSADSSKWYAGGLGNQKHLGRVGAQTEGELPGGQGTVHPLVTVSNSETGHGGLTVRLGIVRAICFNLATVEDTVSQIHLGKPLEMGIFQPDTIETDNQAIWLKCRDAITTAFHPASFQRIVLMAQNAQDQDISSPVVAVNHLVEAHSISEDSRDAILEYFLCEYDSTAYGLAQAVSRAAQDIDSADQSNDLEDLAGAIIRQPSLATV